MQKKRGELESILSKERVVPEWDSSKAVSCWPDWIQEIFRQEADFLYNELMQNRYAYVLTPAPFKKIHSEQMIRVKVTDNPNWYRKLYEMYNSGNYKYQDKNFERRRSLRALKQLKEGIDEDSAWFFVHNTIIADRCKRKQNRRRVKIRQKVELNKYNSIYRNIIFERLTSGHDDDFGQYTPPNNAIRQYFGKKPLKYEYENI